MALLSLIPVFRPPRKLQALAEHREAGLSARALLAGRTFGLPRIARRTIYLRQLPKAFSPLRILQIADVHAGPWMPIERMQRIRRLIRHIGAELIVFSGDQLDRRPSDALDFVDGFGGLEAPLGVWGTLGNHDHIVEPWLAKWTLEEAGIQPLVNDHTVFEREGSSLMLAGVDDPSVAHADFDALANRQADCTILLCHHPEGWHEARRLGVDLTLAGHTHGGQIGLTPTLSAGRFSSKFVRGLFAKDGLQLYVSRGIGVGAMPLRLGSPPELDLLTLVRDDRGLEGESS